MKVDVSLSNARIYDISRIDVLKGEKFFFHTDFTGNSKWFSDNDQVLGLKVAGNNADVEATAAGTSTVLIMDDARNVQKELTISVLDVIEPAATQLGLAADAPVDK